MATKDERAHATVAHYNELFEKKALVFKPTKISKYINKCDRLRWVSDTPFKVEIVQPLFMGTYLFHFPKARVCYMLFDPLTDNEQWADVDFEHVPFNKAKAYMASNQTTYLNQVLKQAHSDIKMVMKKGAPRKWFAPFLDKPREYAQAKLEQLTERLFDNIDAGIIGPQSDDEQVFSLAQEIIWQIGAEGSGQSVESLKLQYDLLGINTEKSR